MPRNSLNKADIILAIKSIKKGIFLSARAAAKALGINYNTLSCRIKRQPSHVNSDTN